MDSWISPGSRHRSIALFPITKLQIAVNCDLSTETQTDNWEWPAGFPYDNFTAEPNVTPQICRLGIEVEHAQWHWYLGDN